jgi:hypothetical protein
MTVSRVLLGGGINYRPQNQKSPACLRCPFGFSQRVIIFWPIPDEPTNATIAKRWLALFQSFNPADYLVA